MHHCKNEKGYILLEIMVFLMVLFIVTFSLTKLISQEYRLMLNQLEREKAYYTAVSAVRLMAGAVMDEDTPLLGEGLDKTSTSLDFQSDQWEVSMPVTIWTEAEEDKLILYAEAGKGQAVQTVFLVMGYEGEWFPLTYGFRQGSKR